MKKLYTLLLILSLGLISNAQSGRIWSTYYGGIGGDGSFSVATDNNGDVYMAGITLSGNGIAANGFQNTFGGGNTDAFIVKFNSVGQRIWGTYFGGNGDEMAFFGGKMEVAVDPFGNVFLGGLTNSTSGIASNNAFQSTNGATVNAYIAKFNSAGSLMWASYYGGTTLEKAYGLATDPFGCVYLAGLSFSTSGIASGGFQNTSGGASDAFLAKFDSSGSRIWATYYGGVGTEEGYSVATDLSGNVFLAGVTSSPNMASGGVQNTFGGGTNDAFLVKFDSAGSRLWATYYGGSGDELTPFSSVLSVTCDSLGNSYLTGLTTSTSGIASNGFQNVYGGGSSDAFLVKFDAIGNRSWATYYGGSDEDKSYDVTADKNAVYIAGRTFSSNNISLGGFRNSIGGDQDAFVAKFDSWGSRLCGTYFGSTGVDECGSVAVDIFGSVYMAGATENTSGIASGGFQNVHGGGTGDAMLVKFESDCLPTSINENFTEKRISLFPNPVSDLLILNSVENGNAKIYDAQGKLIFSLDKESQTISFDLSDFNNGVYFLELVSLDGMITSDRFVVAHQ